MTNLNDFALPERQRFLAGSDHLERELRSAIEYLGPKWVLHPSRRIPKGSYKEPVVQRVDVAATFKAARKRLEAAAPTEVCDAQS